MADIVATGSLSDLGFVEEIQYGVTPTTPILTQWRRRSAAGLNLTKDSYDSEEIRSDRMTADSRHGTRRSGGDIETELSNAAYDKGLEALLGGSWITPAALTSVAMTTANTTYPFALITIAGGTGNWGVGDRGVFSGFGSGANNAAATVVAVPSSTTLVVAKDDGSSLFVQGETGGTFTFTGKKVIIGNAYRSFTFERAFTDIQKYQTYTGMRFNSLQLALPPTGLVTCTWNLAGKNASALQNSSADGAAAVTYTQTDFGTLDFDQATRKITQPGTGTNPDWSNNQEIVVGSAISFDSLVQTSGTDVTQLTGKLLTVKSVTATTVEVNESLPEGTSATYSLTVASQPNYTKASTSATMAAVDGALFMFRQGQTWPEQLAVVTDYSLTIDNQMGGSEVVGKNTIPYSLYGNRMAVTGSVTVLFQDEKLYNLFEQEQTASMILRLDDPDGNFLVLTVPRGKFNSGNIGDAVAEGLPIEMEIRGLKPDAAVLDPGYNDSPIVFQVSNA